jgi:hypothetical protein
MELERNKSAKELESERLKAQIGRSVMRDRLRDDRTRLDALDAQRREAAGRLARFERSARARTVLEPSTKVRGDSCQIVGDDRQRELRGDVDGFYRERRAEVLGPIEAEQEKMRDRMERHRMEAGLHTKAGQRAASQLRSRQRSESQAESDDAVEQEIDPSLVPVWRLVKRRFVDTPKMSRAEAFQHWVDENPEEVLVLQERGAMPTERELERRQWTEEAQERAERARREEAEHELFETEPEEPVEGDIEDVPFN